MAKHIIPVLKKSMAVLQYLAEGHDLTSTKALTQTLGISHATTYRILQTLMSEDWVRPIAGGLFELSFGLLPLLQPIMCHELLITTVRGPLTKLSEDTGLATKLSVRQGNYVITIFRVESSRPFSVIARVGAAFHFAIGTHGTIFLSSLPKAEREHIIDNAPKECWELQSKEDVYRRLREFATSGLCVDSVRTKAGFVAMSAPLYDRDGELLAAITAVGFPQDFEGERRDVLVEQLLAVATDCNRRIQGLPRAKKKKNAAKRRKTT